MAEFKSQFDTSKMGKIETPEQIYAQQQGIQALAGVSNDPMKDIKERYAKLEEKRAKQEAQDPYDNLMARLSSFAQAKPTSGFGVQMAASSDTGQKLQKEQDALRDKPLESLENPSIFLSIQSNKMYWATLESSMQSMQFNLKMPCCLDFNSKRSPLASIIR
jgi:hypothetical protein